MNSSINQINKNIIYKIQSKIEITGYNFMLQAITKINKVAVYIQIEIKMYYLNESMQDKSQELTIGIRFLL